MFPWELQIDHPILDGRGQACLKCIKITNCQYLLTGLTYIDFQQVARLPWKLKIDHTYFTWVWPGMQQGSKSIKLRIFLDFFTTGSVKVDHFNLSVSPSFSPSVDFSFYCGDPLMLCFLSNWLQIPCLLKFWLLRYKPKYFRPFTLQDS